MANGLIKRADVAARIRKESPEELKGFSDDELINKLLERRPDLTDKIESIQKPKPIVGPHPEARILPGIGTSEMTALQKQQRPEFWKKHPYLASGTKCALGTLPGLGAIGGGILTTPETLGMGTVPGAAVGGTFGGALQGIGENILGLSNLTPEEISKNALWSGAISGLGGAGLVGAVKHPIATALALGGAGISPYLRRIGMSLFE